VCECVCVYNESRGIDLSSACVLQCVAVCSSVLQRVAACCSVLQRVLVCCSVLQYVAVCCSVLQCAALRCGFHEDHGLIQKVLVCCKRNQTQNHFFKLRGFLLRVHVTHIKQERSSFQHICGMTRSHVKHASFMFLT